MENKRCTVCGEVKELSEFHKKKASKDGVCCNCKACVKIYSTKWAKENSEKIREHFAKWYKENPEKAKDRNAKYRKENPEKVRVLVAKWAKENPEKVVTASIKSQLKKQIGETPPPELVEIKLLIYKTKKLCKTLKN